MSPTRDSSPLPVRVLRRARSAAAALLVDLVHLEAGLARVEPDDLRDHPEAGSLVKLICETPGSLRVRIDALAEAILPLRNQFAMPAPQQSAFIVRLGDLFAPSYLELLLEAARRYVALIVHSAAATGMASTISNREIRLRGVFEPPPAPVSYMTLGACVEQEFRAIEQNGVAGSPAGSSSPPIESELPGDVSQSATVRAGSVETPDSGRGLLSCADLAATFGVDQERLRGRLKRWQRTCFTGWVEVTDRGPRDPQYLYQVASVMPIIRALQKRGKEKR